MSPFGASIIDTNYAAVTLPLVTERKTKFFDKLKIHFTYKTNCYSKCSYTNL